jgi:hypothetical protein
VKGKPIYLRKFMHDGFVSASNPDQISSETLAAYNAFASELGVNPTFPGLGHVRAGREDAAILLAGAPNLVTTHTLKRRGKRPLVP